ncbi:MAG: ATP-dependent DNA helicase [bacterium]
MREKETVRVAVRDLVGFVHRAGDIDIGFVGGDRALEGIAGHRAVRRERPEGYRAEVALSLAVEGEKVIMEVGGRVDGVIIGSEYATVEEIKTTTSPIGSIGREANPVYWAQLKCYGHMLARQYGLAEVELCLTYYHLVEVKEVNYYQVCRAEELAADFASLAGAYLALLEKKAAWAERRDESICKLGFPYLSYRTGQRELSIAVYRTLRDGKSLFARAPTGIGKTVAVLFSALKAMVDGGEKIFYLTAKTTVRAIVEKTFADLRRGGLQCKTLTLTAKEKLCFCAEMNCRPETCEYAKGHYDRVGAAVAAIFPQAAFTRELILEYAARYQVCPFEFSLELAEWADCVICDYNYVFDPRVYLRRFFGSGGNYLFLVDEAHNLVQRAQEMFSAELKKMPLLALKKVVRGVAPELGRALHRLNTLLIAQRKQCEAGGDWRPQESIPPGLLETLREFLVLAECWLGRPEADSFRADLRAQYFAARDFLRTAADFGPDYVVYSARAGSDVRLKLFCLDPARLLQAAVRRGRATVFFSATLSPLGFYVRMLGGNSDAARLELPSPFPRANLLLLADNRTPTRYRERHLSYGRIAAAVAVLARSKPGNYLAFFPSYEYMAAVYDVFRSDYPSIRTVRQTTGMSEAERDDFLDLFSEKPAASLVGFAVMGGIFGEGIDLLGERLSGAAIIGVGLPQVSPEREIIRQYFTAAGEDGFAYAYDYPGMARVFQAVGRVIRTETDKGVVLLLDERFARMRYRRLFPPEWHPVPLTGSQTDLAERIANFWRSRTGPKKPVRSEGNENVEG